MTAANEICAEPRVTVHDLAVRYTVEEATVRAWFRRGALRGQRLGRQWLTGWDEVFTFEGRLAPPRGEARECAKEPLLTVEVVAERYRKKPATVRQWLRRGRLAGVKIMDEWYTDWSAVRDFELGSSSALRAPA